MNHAPAFLMKEMPQLLGKLQSALMDYEPLPEGISENFFRFMTPENAKKSYENSLHVVEQMRKEKNNGSKEASDEILLKVISDLEFRCALMDRITPLFPDFQRLTVRNTHGDFTVNQILCSNSVVTGIIDFTTACRHPVVWELTRSFFTAEPSCQNGELDTDKFREYISLYEKYLPLSAYDKELLLPVYVYQLAVCDYYSQYLSAAGRKAEEFLEQAAFATKVLRKSEERKDYIKC